MKISWFCRSDAGYGDIVSPLCYAQNQGEMHNTVVQLDMKWGFLKEEHTWPDKTISRLVQILNFPNVIVTHRYGCSLGTSDMNEPLKKINNLNIAHNMFFPAINDTPTLYISCTPLNNNQSFDVYVGGVRKWKQALSDNEWRDIRNKSDVSIDYITSIDDAIDDLMHCKMFEGYHGSCAWLARLIGVPMKIHSSNMKLTNYCFPWAAESREESLVLLEKYRNLRNEYIDTARRLQNVHGG